MLALKQAEQINKFVHDDNGNVPKQQFIPSTWTWIIKLYSEVKHYYEAQNWWVICSII